MTAIKLIAAVSRSFVKGSCWPRPCQTRPIACSRASYGPRAIESCAGPLCADRSTMLSCGASCKSLTVAVSGERPNNRCTRARSCRPPGQLQVRRVHAASNESRCVAMDYNDSILRINFLRNASHALNCSSETYSSARCACRISPGPHTMLGIPACENRPASVP